MGSSITVLKKLDIITKRFIYEVCLKKGMNEPMAKTINGIIRTYGSYQLGVNAEGIFLYLYFNTHTYKKKEVENTFFILFIDFTFYI